VDVSILSMKLGHSHHNMASPQVADGEAVSKMEGSHEYVD